VVAGPVGFLSSIPISATPIPPWMLATLLLASLVAPWAAAVLTVLEWRRRRAEDRATGLARPVRAPKWR
jgi:hypothetical protein